MTQKIIQRILITLICLVGILTIPTISHAVELEDEIQAIIGTSLDEYLTTVDVEKAVDEVVEETLNTFIDKLSAETLASYIIGERFEVGQISYTEEDIKNKADGDYIDAENVKEYEASESGEISSVVNRYLDDLKEKLKSDIVSGTYNYSNNEVTEYINNYLMSNIDAKITTYNSELLSRYSYIDNNGRTHYSMVKDSSTGNWVYAYRYYQITERQRITIEETLKNRAENIINIGYFISNNVLNETSGYCYLSLNVQKYIVDQLNDVTKMGTLLEEIRKESKITVNNELKEIIVESIQSYLSSDSGKAVFTGIKDAIYEYINENGGLDKIYKNGFGEDTAAYIGERIGDIVKVSIQYSIAPYITQLSEGKVKEVTETITAKYVNGTAWKVVVDSINREVASLIDGHFGELVKTNLGDYLEQYIDSTKLVDAINDTFSSIVEGDVSIKNFVSNYYAEDSQGNKYVRDIYKKYTTLGEYVIYQTKNASKVYIKNTIFLKLAQDAKDSMNAYLQGEKGTEIRNTIIERINLVFINNIVEPLLNEINVNVAEWVSRGLGENIIGQIKKVVTSYLEEFKDAEEFAKETGIKLGIIVKEVRYEGQTYSSKKISREKLIRTPSLISAERGAIIVPEYDEYDLLNDATVEIGTIFKYRKKVEELSGGNMILMNPYVTVLSAFWSGCPNLYGVSISLPFGPSIGIATLSRTVGKYTTKNIKVLEPEEAYVLAHQKNTNYYPDRVQFAYWKVLEDVRGLKYKEDDGPIDPDLYRKVMMILSFANLLQLNWESMYNQITNAKTWGDMLAAVDNAIIATILNAAGISLHTIFPFIDPDILAIANLFGVNLYNITGFLKTGFAAAIDWSASGLDLQLKHELGLVTGSVENVEIDGDKMFVTYKGISQEKIENAFETAYQEMKNLVDGTTITKLYDAGKEAIESGIKSVEDITKQMLGVVDAISEINPGEIANNAANTAVKFAESILEKLNLSFISVKVVDLARLAGTTIENYLKFVLGVETLDMKALSSHLVASGLSEAVSRLLQFWLPMKNELVENYQAQDPGDGYEIYLEAMALGKAVDNYEAFYKKNEANLVDRTDYSKVKVSYAKTDDSIVVGPFTIDYVREYFMPTYTSDMVDTETGIISYMGIVEAELYADDAKTVKIENWEFVYPDVTRTCRSTDDWSYEYPYPNETFYLRFPSTENYSVNTLSQLELKLEKMDADGQTYETRGDFDQLLWMTTGVPIPCIPVLCYCPMGHIGPAGAPCSIGTLVPHGVYYFCIQHSAQGIAQAQLNTTAYSAFLSTTGWAAPVIDNVKTAIGAWKVSSMVADKIPTWLTHIPFPVVHWMGMEYFCFPIPVASGYHGMNLEDIIYSKIYTEYETVSLELGEVQTYYNNNVNTTDVLYPVQNQGNLSEETAEVPTLPFLPNYAEYPGYPNYPDYEGNPNYPSNPYYYDNSLYEDYPSYPYYYGDATYPYYPSNHVIPLTFHIEGTVWLDNPSGYEAEANGIKEDGERGIPNVEVIAYKVGDPNYIAKTLTDENGHYIFEYLRVGADYYVEFAYDGITYKSTKYLKSESTEYLGEDVTNLNDSYKATPEKYLDASHAIEDVGERDNFNDKFYHISENLATGTDGSKIPLEYKTWYTDNGAVSTAITTDSRGITLDDFKMYSRTIETDLYFALNDAYQVDYNDCNLYGDNTSYLTHTYPGLENVNFGLIKREQGDFTIKTDVYQIITTIKEDVQRYKYDEKVTDSDTYDILYRTGDYYTENPYRQEIDPDDHAYRIDSSYADYAEDVSGILSLADEMNIYVEYKILIQNNSTLQAGRVIVLENSFDEDQTYSTEYDFTDLTSWVEVPMNGSEETTRQEITWHYRQNTENGYTTIYTTGLADKDIQVGEVVELHLILKLNKDANRNIILDNGNRYQFDGYDPNDQDINTDEVKEAITEIHTYHFNEGLIDKSSNPGSIVLGNPRTYSDGSDPAPFTKVFYNLDYHIGNTITGYVWEDLIDGFLEQKNEYTSNGLRDKVEPLINNVKVELVEVVTDKETGKEVEVLRKTASKTDSYRTGENIVVDNENIEIKDGQYLFSKLDTGIYRVKFTYGDEYQLTKDITYNAQDYRSVSVDTTIQQYENPDLEVMLLLDTSEGMQKDEIGKRMSSSAQTLIDNLYEQIQKVKVGGMLFSEPVGKNDSYMGLREKPDKQLLKQLFTQEAVNVGGNLAEAINKSIQTFNSKADGKVIVILTDGYMQYTAQDRYALKLAESLGIKVVTIACSTDEWDKATFGTEAEPTTGNLYNIRKLNIYDYVTEVVLEDIMLEFEETLPNLTDAKDIQDEYALPEGSKVGEVYSRKRNIDYSSTLTNEKAEILDIDLINLLNDKEKEKAIKVLADNTQVTAMTPNRNIVISHDNNRTTEVNLGLVERAKAELKIQEKVSKIVVTLSNGDVLIDTSKDLTQNVQIIKNKMYSIYMDEEIMQGATINVEYKITITNNGQVDRLANYFTYDMFDEKAVAYMNRTVPIRIGTINNYYSNLTFRAEENNGLEVETNKVELSKVRFDETTVSNWNSFVSKGKTTTATISNIEVKTAEDGRAKTLKETITWVDRNLVDLNDRVSKKIDDDVVKIVETDSLEHTELFPTTSKEVLNNLAETSININVKYSKTISANDSQNDLTYADSSEIVRRISDVGRRDYIGVPGNYIPNDQVVAEYDSAIAERIIILPPFGKDNTTYYWLAVVSGVILLGGIIFIKKKIM